MRDYSQMPNQNMAEGMKRYIEKGIEPGGFLSAILRNDLRAACLRADDINKHLIFEHVYWLYNQAPIQSWGSEENVDAWVKQTRAEQEAES